MTQQFGGMLALPSATLDQLTAELCRRRWVCGAITRRQRAWQFSLVLGPMLAAGIFGAQGLISDVDPVTQLVKTRSSHTYQASFQNSRIVACVRSLAKPHPLPADTVAVAHRRAAGIYLREMLHEPPDSIPKQLSSPVWQGRYRSIIDSLRGEPAPSEAEIDWARGEFARGAKPESGRESRRGILVTAMMVFSILLPLGSFVIAPGTGGGPLLRALGIAVVRSDGRSASKRAILLRSIVTWSPCLVFCIGYPVLHGGPFERLAMILPLVLFVVGTAYAILRPQRSIQDRCARTWLVPC